MQTVFEAAGGTDGLRRLAEAWHRRVMEDEVVARAEPPPTHSHQPPKSPLRPAGNHNSTPTPSQS